MTPPVPDVFGIPTMTPEDALILACARRRPGAAELDRARGLLSGRLDWDAVSWSASMHGVLPLCHRTLAGPLRAQVPKEALAALSEASAGLALRSLRLARDLLSALSVLGGAGVEAVPFKGPVLAVAAYGDVALRQYCDVDVMVRPGDVFRARDALRGAGWSEIWPGAVLPAGREAAWREADYACEFESPEGSRLELHWAFSRRCEALPLDPAPLFGRLGRVVLGGSEVPSFTPEDTLLILSVHGAKHLWERLEWVCAVAEFVAATPGLDWETLLAEARRFGCLRMLGLSLELAVTLLSAPVPPGVMERAASGSAVSELASLVIRGLFQCWRPPESSPRLLLFRLRCLDSFSGRLHSLAAAFGPTPRDLLALPFPDPVGFLGAVFRPLRLAVEYGLRPFSQKLSALARERRESERRRLRLRVTWAEDGAPRAGHTWDVSVGGAYVMTQKPLAAGVRAEFTFEGQSGGEPVVVEGVSAWVNDGRAPGLPPGFGMRFSGTPAPFFRRRMAGGPKDAA